MDRIPKCKHRDDGHGFYVKVIRAVEIIFDENGENGLGVEEHVRGGEIAYCENCNARIGRVQMMGDSAIIFPNHCR